MTQKCYNIHSVGDVLPGVGFWASFLMVTPMIDVKKAIAKAVEFLSDIFGSEGISGIRLEEVELSDAQDAWNITLSFVRRVPPNSVSSPLDVIRATQAAALGVVPMGEREYKVVSVDSGNGAPRSVKVRQLV